MSQRNKATRQQGSRQQDKEATGNRQQAMGSHTINGRTYNRCPQKGNLARSFRTLNFGFRTLCSLVVAMVLLAVTGCVRRTMTISTDPPNARIFLNDQEIGRSEVSTDFLWYGDYDVVIRKEGYQTLKTHWKIDPPWYEEVPLDFFFECLWPGQLHDQHSNHFTLAEAKTPSAEEVLHRSEELREKVTEPGP